MTSARTAGPDQRRVAVIGAGVVGLSTAWALQQRGHEVTVIDPNPPGSGQSNGDVRALRVAHPSAQAVSLAGQSLAIWHSWERQFGVRLLTTCGLALCAHDLGRWESAMRQARARYEIWNRKKCAQRLTLITDLPGDWYLFDPTAAAIDAAATIDALTRAIAAAGWELLPEQAMEVLASTDCAEVVTDARSHKFDRVIVCAGAGTRALVTDLGFDLETATVVRSYALAKPRQATEAPLEPMWIQRLQHGREAWYQPTPRGEVVVAADWSASDPAAVTAGTFEAAEEYIRERLGGVDASTAQAVDVPMSPVRMPPGAIVAIGSSGPVTVAAGNHLFKFAPLLGTLLADMSIRPHEDLPNGVSRLVSA